MSSENIDKGERWAMDIATQLQETHYGIICVTPQNLEAPWLLFESGALSKSMNHSKVLPIIFGLEQSDLTKSPLLQFQVSSFSKSEIKKVLTSINNSAPDAESVSAEVLNKSFERAWSELEDGINQPDIQNLLKEAAKKKAPAPPPSNSIETAVQEILSNSRAQIRLLNSPDTILPPAYLEAVVRYSSQTLPRVSSRVWRDVEAGLVTIRAVVEKLSTSAIEIGEASLLASTLDKEAARI